ncbi:dicarboxylate/amino acid:cation (Na or H) symporter (DAACS) family protein [Thraustotheca clavata]|uniref:Amino acid transporter n=1 Tax=Thraustotheca clavata TaxID=74557 RepID=A0A1W0A3K2_9STRA|nr:dicarboxylate/amino acid:cation (Na or H) symporter (DAACS) family protein [Thraustotheca clavata]
MENRKDIYHEEFHELATPTGTGENGNLRPPAPPLQREDHLRGDPIMEENPRNAIMRNAYEAIPLGLRSSFFVLICAGIGVGLGYGLGKANLSADTKALVALPGDLFVRCLKCLIVPLVFCTISSSVAEIIVLNNASFLTWRTAGLFYLTSFLSTCQGMTFALIYRNFVIHDVNNNRGGTNSLPKIALKCANGLFLHSDDDGSVSCLDKLSNTTASQFSLVDVNKSLNLASSTATLSIIDQAIGIVNQLVPENIFSAFSEGALLSVVAFALPFGFAMALTHSEEGPNLLLQIVRQVRNAFVLLITAALRFTPVAVLFLIANATATFTSSASQFASQAGYAVLFFFCGVFTHVLIVLPLIMVLLIRINPYAYMLQLIPAYVFGFGCSSSMATLPVAVTVIHQTRRVSWSTANIAMCLGTPANLNGPGLFHPTMVVFMAQVSGHGSELTIPKLVILFFISLLGSIGTAPVPNAGLVMLLTIWKTVFPNIPLPHSFVYIVAIDAFLDRFRTMINLNGNMMVTRILANAMDQPPIEEEN